jgi:hypothetical protein
MQIPLTKNKFALVDDDMFDELSKFNWCYYTAGYAARGVKLNSKSKTIYMHRQIMKAKINEVVDHIDGNTLNNCRQNLRICRKIDNRRNMKTPITNTSGHKGVTWYKPSKKWKAQISVDNKCINLGHFSNKLDAAIKYNNAAEKYHGRFARLNLLQQ